MNTASCSVSSFTAALNALGPFESSPHIAVALSGGADSTLLLQFARAWADACGGRVSALIVDHRLRAESTREAEDVAARLDATILTPEHEHISTNLPERAREWRYRALTDWCREHDVLHLLVAHHADDQAETVALHRARGATEDGGSGMAAVMLRDGVRILRPMLGMHKREIVALLEAQQLRWVEDPSNADLSFRRNAIRHQMTQEQQAQLLQQAQAEGSARALRDDAFAQAAARIVTVGEAQLHLDHAALLALPDALATRLLADALCTVSGSHTRPRQHETRGLHVQLQETGFRRATLKHCLIEKRGETLHITPEPHKIRAERQPKMLAASPFWWFNPSPS